MKISVSCLGAVKKAAEKLETTEGGDKKTSQHSSKSPVYSHLTSHKPFGLFPVPSSQNFLKT